MKLTREKQRDAKKQGVKRKMPVPKKVSMLDKNRRKDSMKKKGISLKSMTKRYPQKKEREAEQEKNLSLPSEAGNRSLTTFTGKKCCRET